jgi:hypothetical protein
MTRPTWKLWPITPLIMALAFPCYGAMVCGSTRDANGQAASGVQVVAKDSGGATLGQATSGTDGKYAISGLPQGPISLFCDPGSTGFKPGSGALTLTEAGSNVDWQLSNAAAALAAQTGPCSAAAAWTTGEIASLAVLGLAGAGGIAALVWGLEQCGDEPCGPTTPPVTPVTPTD